MISKQFRLITKDVNYILKKRQVIYGSYFIFFFITQHPNKSYNQFAIQLSTKIHKRATKRNKLKRVYYDIIEKNGLIYNKGVKQNTYYKTIALPHKHKIEEINRLLQQKDWKHIHDILSYDLKKL